MLETVANSNLETTRPHWLSYVFPKSYSKQQALKLGKEILLQLLFVIAFATIYYFLYHFSRNWFTHKYWTTWFLPAGWQIGCMLILPYRYWISVLMGHIIVNLVITINYGNTPNFDLLYILSKTPWKFAVGFVVWQFKARFKNKFLTHFKGVLAFLGCVTIVQLIVGLTLTFTSRFFATIPEDRKFEIMLSFLIGGVIGNLFVATSLLAIKQIWQDKKSINWHKMLGGITALALLGIMACYLYSIQPHTLYLLRVLAFIPIIWFASRYGWIGGCSSSMLAMILIAVSVYQAPDTAMVIESQFYVVALGISGLLFGALINEQRHLQNTLIKRSHDLESSLNKNRQLSNQITSVQEQERRKFSNELHDEVGQNLTALKTELKVLELSLGSKVSADSFSQLKKGTDQIYDSVYRVMNWLRPRVLDELGLKASLSGNYFSSRLKQAGINYHAAVKGNTDKLNDNQTITVFRIVQESVNNCIRHSGAKNFYLLMNISSHKLELNISDDGNGVSATPPSPQGGFGLSGIEERILSLNGHYQLNTGRSGFSLKLSIPLKY